jgi:hypothetical protein
MFIESANPYIASYRLAAGYGTYELKKIKFFQHLIVFIHCFEEKRKTNKQTINKQTLQQTGTIK